MSHIWDLVGAQAVLVHQLSRRASQNPFRKNRGRVVQVAFHPAKPFFFVAARNGGVRVYNLAKQELAKKLAAGSATSCLAVHPSGDHVIVGGEARQTLFCTKTPKNPRHTWLRPCTPAATTSSSAARRAHPTSSRYNPIP